MKIMFICLGNICRSPLLHHLLKFKLKNLGISDRVEIDSCGTTAWNLGDDMNPRVRAEAKKRGFKFGEHRAKLFQDEMLAEYDYIFVVTPELMEVVKEHASEGEKEKVLLATHFSSKHKEMAIPDPYYGDDDLVEKVFQMIQSVVDDLAEKLQKELTETD